MLDVHALPRTPCGTPAPACLTNIPVLQDGGQPRPVTGSVPPSTQSRHFPHPPLRPAGPRGHAAPRCGCVPFIAHRLQSDAVKSIARAGKPRARRRPQSPCCLRHAPRRPRAQRGRPALCPERRSTAASRLAPQRSAAFRPPRTLRSHGLRPTTVSGRSDRLPCPVAWRPGRRTFPPQTHCSSRGSRARLAGVREERQRRAITSLHDARRTLARFCFPGDPNAPPPDPECSAAVCTRGTLRLLWLLTRGPPSAPSSQIQGQTPFPPLQAARTAGDRYPESPGKWPPIAPQASADASSHPVLENALLLVKHSARPASFPPVPACGLARAGRGLSVTQP